MKITVWTLASDDDNGTQAAVFTTEHAAQTAYYNAVFTEPEAGTAERAKDALDTKNYDYLHDIAQSYLDGSLDTYSIDSQELDIPEPSKPVQAENPIDDDYVARARKQYERDGEIEIDEGATVSHSDDGGAYVAAWVWVDALPEECSASTGECHCSSCWQD